LVFPVIFFLSPKVKLTNSSSFIPPLAIATVVVEILLPDRSLL